MRLDALNVRRRLALFGRTWALVVMVLSFPAPVWAWEFLLDSPDGLLAFQTEQDRQSYVTWVREGHRTAWLYFTERLWRPCGRGQNEECQRNMVTVRNQYPEVLKKARLVVGDVKERFLASLRNGNFIYPIAPSYQLLQAIVRQPGNCAAWAAVANQQLGVTSGALRLLSDEADEEIPRDDGSRERKALNGERGRQGLLVLARSCNTL